jgi:hypothetical protein
MDILDTLKGPDASEQPIEPVAVIVADDVEVRAWQFCNRWVFLAHQRSAALRELRRLIADAVVDRWTEAVVDRGHAMEARTL